MSEFAYQDPFPVRTGLDAISPDHFGFRLDGDLRRAGDPQGRPRGTDGPGPRGIPRRLIPLSHGAPREGRRDPGRPRSLGQRSGRRDGAAAERRGGLRLPTADVPGYRHGHGRRQEGPARLDRRGKDEEWLARGIYETYQKENLRYSQTVPADDVRGDQLRARTCRPRSTSTPTTGRKYEFLFVAKGGGSANKSMLFQETKALLNPASLENVPRPRSCARWARRRARRITWRS